MDPFTHRRRAVAAARIAAILLGVAMLAACASRPAPPGPRLLAPTSAPHGLAIDVATPGFTVDDLDRSIAFFTTVLDFTLVSRVEAGGGDAEALDGVFPVLKEVALLALGQEQIELTQYLAPRGRPTPPGARSNDRSFQHIAIVVSDMDEAYARLRRHRVLHVSSAPQRLPDWNPAAGGIQAFYFNDPDGHVLELIAFPPGKGQSRWQRRASSGASPFLGIDHTAVAIADTDRALSFYRDALGFAIVGTSENWGIEQARLNAVAGARLRITALRTDAPGPAIELLEYLSPRDGRDSPADLRACDVLHWQTTVVVDDVEAALRRVRRAGGSVVSDRVVALDGRDAGARAVLVRDPDGHGLVLVGR